jgi:hypothetical protein
MYLEGYKNDQIKLKEKVFVICVSLSNKAVFFKEY